MKSKILEIIEKKYEKTNGHCGTYATDLMKHFKCKYIDIKKHLIELYLENKIIIKPGIHGNLIFKNGSNRNNKSN